MEFLLNRYRNLTVLLVVITAQLMLIAYQVKTSKDVPLLRVWAVTAVTPVERVLEIVRRNTWGFVEDYFVLLHTREENAQLRKEIGQLKLDNQFLKTELSTADRASALSVFQKHSPSKTVAARILGNGLGANSKVVFVDRGSGSGVESGMAAVTPDGIVGKVVAAYPTASLVLLITDVNFAAGVISQKNRVHGTLKGQGHDGNALVDYVQNEEKVEPGEWFFTSGDDRIFPRGFPVGQVTAVRNGRRFKEIYVNPSGFQPKLEEILIVLDPVHQPIPDVEVASPNYKLLAPPAGAESESEAPTPTSLTTDADRLKDQYKQVPHAYGSTASGAPDFSKLPSVRETQPKPVAPSANAPQKAPDIATPPAPVTTKPADPASATPAPDQVPTQPKPRPKAPPLVTDPTDADPSEPAFTPPPPAKPKPKMQQPFPGEFQD
jgi:rod shape-determining protein MreC